MMDLRQFSIRQFSVRLSTIAIGALFMAIDGTTVNATSQIHSSIANEPISQQEPQSTAPGTPPPDASGSPRPLCSLSARNPVILARGEGTDFTFLEQPVLWFYVGSDLEKIGFVEIVLRDESYQTLARYEVRSIEGSGIVKVTLPYTLEEYQNYQVLLKIYCENKHPDDSNPGGVVVSWIQRRPESSIELPPNLEPLPQYQAYRDGEIWYDAISTLAELHYRNPDNPEIRQMWKELLEAIARVQTSPDVSPDLEWLADEPLVSAELHPLSAR